MNDATRAQAEICTGGGCEPNPGSGGFGVVLLHPQKRAGASGDRLVPCSLLWKQQTADNVPENPTPDRGPLLEASERSTKHGDFPGADLGATQVNHAGSLHISTP